MCRIAAYYGPPLALSALFREASHSLEHQSQHAQEMADSHVAGDGWGVGWFASGTARPGLIKSILPLWSDLNAKTALHAMASGSIVGHIRLASPELEVCFTNTPLYVLDDLLYTMNGSLSPWPGPLSRALRDQLDGKDEAAIQGTTDAEMLGALIRTCLRRRGREDMLGALRQALRLTHELTQAYSGKVKANLIVASATGFWAVRYCDSGTPNSLYVLQKKDSWQGAALVASEPLDEDPGWKSVEPSTIVWADDRGLHQEPLDL